MSSHINLSVPATTSHNPRRDDVRGVGCSMYHHKVAVRVLLTGQAQSEDSAKANASHHGRTPKMANQQLCFTFCEVLTIESNKGSAKGGAQRAGRCWTLKMSTSGAMNSRLIGPLVCRLLACHIHGACPVDKMATIWTKPVHEVYDSDQNEKCTLLIREAWAASYCMQARASFSERVMYRVV
jgi:hypothetical protein